MNNNLKYVKEKLGNSFDVKYRNINTVLGLAVLVYIDNLCNTKNLSEYVVAPLKNIKTLPEDNRDKPIADQIMEGILDINLTGLCKDLDDGVFHILSGDPIIIFENLEEVIYVDTKAFPVRSVGTTETESVLKGPREGFNELMVNNVALIRKRIKNSDLRFEALIVGDESNTSVAISYIDGIAPKDLIEEIKNKVKNLDLRFILDTNYIEDALKEEKSVFDTVGYTEKPDEICAKLLEGRVAVIVDGTSFVITVPHFFLENFQTPDDYYLNKYVANFNRILRWFAFFLASMLPGLYVATITYHFSMLPSAFLFRLAVARSGVPFPAYVEVIIMIIAFQLIKEAGLRIPQPIGGTMSIVAGLILGDAAVGVGIASRITIIVIAISSLSYFLIPKLYGALSFWGIILVIFSSVFGIPGFLCGASILLINLAELNTVSYQFLFPIGSIKKLKFKDVVLRGSLSKISNRIIEEDTNEK